MKYRESIFTQRLFVITPLISERPETHSCPHSEHLFSKILTVGTPSNFPSHATMVASDHLNFTISLPPSGHVTVPWMSRITIARPPLLNDVVSAVDLSFHQLDQKYMVDQIITCIFIYLGRKYHCSGRKTSGPVSLREEII